jgi:hypothetical protein
MSGGQRRQDHFRYMLGPGRGIEQQFGSWYHGLVCGVQKYPADGIGNRTAARFPRGKHCMAPAAQRFAEQGELGGFATPFNAFESNKQ